MLGGGRIVLTRLKLSLCSRAVLYGFSGQIAALSRFQTCGKYGFCKQALELLNHLIVPQ